jgi:hypothetical protein
LCFTGFLICNNERPEPWMETGRFSFGILLLLTQKKDVVLTNSKTSIPQGASLSEGEDREETYQAVFNEHKGEFNLPNGVALLKTDDILWTQIVPVATDQE